MRVIHLCTHCNAPKEEVWPRPAIWNLIICTFDSAILEREQERGTQTNLKEITCLYPLVDERVLLLFVPVAPYSEASVVPYTLWLDMAYKCVYLYICAPLGRIKSDHPGQGTVAKFALLCI